MPNPTPQDPNSSPMRPKPLKPQPVQPQGVRPQPVKPQGVRPQPVKPQGVRPQPVKPQGVRPQPVKPQGVRPQPVKPQGVRPQPVKPQAVPAGTPLGTPGKKGIKPVPVAVGSEPAVISSEAISFTAELSEVDAANFLMPKDEYLEKTIQVEEPKEEEEELSEKIAAGAPPWLLSTIGHIIVILIGALIFTVSPPVSKPIVIECTTVIEEEEIQEEEERFLEEVGVQEEIETETYVETDQPEAAEMAEEDKPVEDPMLEPEAAPPSETGTLAAHLKEAPVGARFNGRNPGGRKGLLGKYGGTKSTEDAVEMGLEWLVRQQTKNGPARGSWSLAGPYSDGLDNDCENRVAATAMALLAFQGAGYTQHPPKLTDEERASKKKKSRALKAIKDQSKYRQVIATGWTWLLKQQGENGEFFPADGLYNHRFYTHAQVTIALCELYGMTKEGRYRIPAQKAINYLVSTQHQDGAWRYNPTDEMSDLSVTGWVLMALQSAKMAELEVPQTAFDGITRYLDSNGSTNAQTYYRYTIEEVYPSLSMTAEGILCRQYLGWEQKDSRMEQALDYLLKTPVSFKGDTDVYYWYYATQAMHHMEGRWWKEWNAVMRQELPTNQVRTGAERGSWSPLQDRYADGQGGRLFMTCLSIYMLEVYYRHLPIYAKIFDENGNMVLDAEPAESEAAPAPAPEAGTASAPGTDASVTVPTAVPAPAPTVAPTSDDSGFPTPQGALTPETLTEDPALN